MISLKLTIGKNKFFQKQNEILSFEDVFQWINHHRQLQQMSVRII